MLFIKKLTSWYLDNKRDLPWRETRDPYRIWLSEIILQQTRVAQGEPYYFRFLEKFATVFDLAAATEEQVLKEWQGLGYYSRARNLHSTAKYIALERSGKFPVDYKGLLKLKGVGDYTASAIASICYNEKVAVVDGNVYRVLSRIFGIDTPIDSSEGKQQFKKLAEDLLDQEDPATFNQGLMEFGALHCTPQKPQCGTCPFVQDCVAFGQNRTNEFPVKAKKQKVRKRHFNYLVYISEEKKTLLTRRNGKDIWEGLYEFPLMETTDELNCSRIKHHAHWNQIPISQGGQVDLYNQQPIVHKLSHQHIYTKFWIVTCKDLPAHAVSFEDVYRFPVPVLIEKFIEGFDF